LLYPSRWDVICWKEFPCIRVLLSSSLCLCISIFPTWTRALIKVL
jgi:hypothetical protein